MGKQVREIKFRGKTNESTGMRSAGEWAYGGYFMDDCYGGCPEGKHYIVEWNSTGMGYFAHTKVERETVGQFTGLHDKNGKEIYEGDVIEYPDYSGGAYIFGKQPLARASVKWTKETGGYRVPGTGYSFPSGKCKVIGNIFENPELLEEGK